MTRSALAACALALIAARAQASPSDPAAPAEAEPATADSPAAAGSDDAGQPESIEVQVKAPAKAASPQGSRVNAESARVQAGTMGDTVMAVQNLAGVARSRLASGELVVWGSTAAETTSFIDGIEVPSLFHLGGLRSVLPSPFVRAIELVPGGFSVAFGRALGGLATVETKALPEEGFHGHAAFDFYDGTVTFSGATDGVRYGVALRASWLDLLLEAVVDEDLGDQFVLPRYQDGVAKVSFALGEGEDLTLTLLHRSDQLERARPAADPNQRRSDLRTISSERLSVRYRAANEQTSSSAQIWVGYDDQARSFSSAGVPASTRARTSQLALRLEHQRLLTQAEWLGAPFELRGTLGIDARAVRTQHERLGSFTIPPREGDVVVFGQPPGGEVGRDDWSTGLLDPAAYAAALLRWGRLSLTPGLRVSAGLNEVSRTTPRAGTTPALGGSRLDPSFEPRVALEVDLGEGGLSSASCSLHSQAPNGDDRSAVFGSPDLDPARALQLVFGHRVSLLYGLQLGATVFYKSLSQLAVRPAERELTLAQSLLSRGDGTAYGTNFSLAQPEIAGFSGSLSYSLSRARREGPLGRERLFDFDQTHVLNLLLNQSLAGFNFGLRFRVASGTPYTPVIGAYFNAKEDRYEPVFGEHNSERLPAFYQLDLRAEKQFSFADWWLRVFLDVQNVTNAENVEELAYAYDFGEPSPVLGLPVFGTLGVAAEF